MRKKYSNPNGLKTALYNREIDGVMFYSLAFTGTEVGIEDYFDIFTDGFSGIGVLTPQIKGAIELSKRVDQWVENQGNGNHMTLTGHSLGGGEAAIGSMATGRPATTFNAMGIDLKLGMKQPYFIIQEQLISAYIIWGEPLDMGQLAKANGTKHYLMPKLNSSFLGKHGIDQFLNRAL